MTIIACGEVATFLYAICYKIVYLKLPDEPTDCSSPSTSTGILGLYCPDPEVIKLFSCSTEHEILNAHKDKNVKKFSLF